MSETNGNPTAEAALDSALSIFDKCSKMEHDQNLPPDIGKHDVTVTRLRVTMNGKTESPMVIIEMEVDKGASQGRKAVKFYTLDPDKPKQLEMLYWDLHALGEFVPKVVNADNTTRYDWSTWIKGHTNALPYNIESAEGVSLNITVKANKNPAFGPNIWIACPDRFRAASTAA